MPIKYSDLSLARLRQKMLRIEKAIAAREARDKKAAMAKIAAVAKEVGLELSELSNLDVKEPRSGKRSAATPISRRNTARKEVSGVRRGKVAPKYRNPDDPSTV